MLAQERFEDQVRDLYSFFVNAELNNEEVTYEQIQERLLDRKYDTLVWYANNFWTWFLEKKEKRGRYRVLLCRGLVRYPEDFFVRAHLNRQGKYFYHFGRALDDSRERARLRKQAKDQVGDVQPDLTQPPDEADQEFPEELHFANNEGEEMESGESSETSIPQEPAPSMSLVTREDPAAHDEDAVERYPVGTSVTIWERIVAMLGFSGKDHEIEQLRVELTGRMQALEGQLQTVITTLSGFQSDVRDQARLVTQALTQEMSSRVEGLTREIQQSRHSSVQTDLSQQIERAKKDLVIAIERIPISVDLAPIQRDMQINTEQIQRQLLEALQQPSASSIEVIEVRQDVARLTGMLEAFAENLKLLVPSATNGTERSIHERIRLYLDQVHNALGTLERAHALWLQEHIDQLQDLERQEQEAYKGRQELLQSIFVHISPQPQDGEKTQEEMSQEAGNQESSLPEQAEDGDTGEGTNQQNYTS